jgi:hypothetical protein
LREFRGSARMFETPHQQRMKTQETILPSDIEIAEFFEQIRRDIKQPVTAPIENGEQEPEHAEIVLDNTSRSSGTVLAVYGKLE